MPPHNARALAIVRLKGPDTAWTTLGADHARGIVAESLQLSANESGPDTCSFRLRRRPGAGWPDLAAFNQCQVDVGGVTVWAGRVWETPGQTGRENSIQVSGRGWQYHLDDDLFQRSYVHTRLGDYQDQRDALDTDLAFWTPNSWKVHVDGGVIVMGVEAPVTVPNGSVAGVFLDLGTTDAKRVVVTVRGGGQANFRFRVRGGTTSPTHGAENYVLATTLPTTDTTYAQTFTGLMRYVQLIFDNNTGGVGTGNATTWCAVSSVKVFSATAWESGNASILKASQVVLDARAGAPLLSTDNSRIQTTSFSIPEMTSAGAYRTPRQIMQAANAYHDWLLGVDTERRVFFRARPTAPLVEVGAWSGHEFQGGAANSGEGLYNRAIVQATGPDGQRLYSVRTAASSLLTRQGFTRAAVLPIQAALTPAAADAIGDAWLATKTSAPLKGSLRLTGMGSVRTVPGGEPLHPSRLLLLPGELMRLSDRANPATGGWGQDAAIASVAYNHDDGAASVELDNERNRLEALLSRLGLLQDQLAA